MLINDTSTRDKLARIIRKNIDDVVSTQVRRGTQEPAITAKVGERLETALNGKRINGFEISVVAQDFSDRGRLSQESLTGADLFVGMRVQNSATGFDVSKGMLVQAKKVSGASQSEKVRLVNQCRQLTELSSAGSYVWIYDTHGARAIPASEVSSTSSVAVTDLTSKNITMHFRDVLDCVAGDVGLANRKMFEGPEQLKQAIEELSARSGIAISLRKVL